MSRDDQAFPVRPDPGDRTSMTLLGRLRSERVDEEAWARLLHLYEGLVRYWARRKGVVGADAEDAVQEVFLAVAFGLPDFRRDRDGDSFRAWLRGITRFVLLRHAEKSSGRAHAAGGTAAYEGLQGLPAEEDEEPDPPTELNALYRRGLELVRSEFEPRTWRAFLAHVVDGRPPAEIAAEMGISSAAVRQAKSRVLRRLREELGDLIE